MFLASLPDRRSAAAPHAPAVADDARDYDNAGFLDAVTRPPTPCALPGSDSATSLQ